MTSPAFEQRGDCACGCGRSVIERSLERDGKVYATRGCAFKGTLKAVQEVTG